MLWLLFFLWRIFFSTNFLHVGKNEENNIISTWSLNLLQNASKSSILFSSSFICMTVSNASWRVKFCEKFGNIWNYWDNRTTYRIWLRLFASSIFLVINPCRPCWMTCTNFSKPGYFSTIKVGDVNFFLHFWHK